MANEFDPYSDPRRRRTTVTGDVNPSVALQPMGTAAPRGTATPRGSRPNPTQPYQTPGYQPSNDAPDDEKPPPNSQPPSGPWDPGTLPGFGTGRLEGFGGQRQDGTGKLGSDHALKSPKYAFGDVFQNFQNTREGFESGFKELQRKYPQFFANWAISGDDSIVWSGQGELNEAFQGHKGFDVWRNASGEDGGPGGWQWETHADPWSDAANGSDTDLSDLLALFQTQSRAPQWDPLMIPGRVPESAPPPQAIDLSALLSMFQPQGSAGPSASGEVPQGMDLNLGALPQAVRMLSQRNQVVQNPETNDPLMAMILRSLGRA